MQEMPGSGPFKTSPNDETSLPSCLQEVTSDLNDALDLTILSFFSYILYVVSDIELCLDLGG